MFIPPNTLPQSSKVGLTSRRIAAASMTLIFAATAAFAQTCPADRTPLEMARHTLCLLNTAMPKIFRSEDGTVNSLSWSYPERFPPEVQLPPGTFHLIVETDTHIPPAQISPSLEDSEPSDLPLMRETPYSQVGARFPTRKRLHPLQARLNGQPFVLECGEAIAPHRKGLGAHDCQLISQFASGIWLEVHLATVDWTHGPAWPRLDQTWAETWPPYLDDLGSGISNLLSIQQ